jgi:hypothetical protein
MASDTMRVVARLKAHPDREALAQFPGLLADELDVRRYSLIG